MGPLISASMPFRRILWKVDVLFTKEMQKCTHTVFFLSIKYSKAKCRLAKKERKLLFSHLAVVRHPNLLRSHLITVNRPIQAEPTHKAWTHKAGGQ